MQEGNPKQSAQKTAEPVVEQTTDPAVLEECLLNQSLFYEAAKVKTMLTHWLLGKLFIKHARQCRKPSILMAFAS